MKDGEWQYHNGGVVDLLEKYKINDVFSEFLLEQELPIEILGALQLYHDNIADSRNPNHIVKQLEEYVGEDLSELIMD